MKTETITIRVPANEKVNINRSLNMIAADQTIPKWKALKLVLAEYVKKKT